MGTFDRRPELVDRGAHEGPPEDLGEPITPRRVPLGESNVVERYLPTRGRTTVGAWCFLDHYGPDDVTAGPGMVVGPHPHIGLQTVTWLFEGAVRHRDSLGIDQLIEPGQLNLMTAGLGIAHAEVSPSPHPAGLHGVQLWVALPAGERAVPPAFAHHGDLPAVDLGGATATVIVGDMGGARSPAHVYSPLLGVEVDAPSTRPVVMPLDEDFEHAVLVSLGSVSVDGRALPVGSCYYLGRARRQLELAGAPTGRLLVGGGEPYAGPLVMWWNFVGGAAEEIVAARDDWEAGRRFGPVASGIARTPAPALPPGRLLPRR